MFSTENLIRNNSTYYIKAILYLKIILLTGIIFIKKHVLLRQFYRIILEILANSVLICITENIVTYKIFGFIKQIFIYNSKTT